VEITFEMSKGRFRILFKRINISLCHMLGSMMIWICLHNMCIANSNGFNMEWALEVKKKALTKENSTFGNVK
jgi:hypothetical protein